MLCTLFNAQLAALLVTRAQTGAPHGCSHDQLVRRPDLPHTSGKSGDGSILHTRLIFKNPYPNPSLKKKTRGLSYYFLVYKNSKSTDSGGSIELLRLITPHRSNGCTILSDRFAENKKQKRMKN